MPVCSQQVRACCLSANVGACHPGKRFQKHWQLVSNRFWTIRLKHNENGRGTSGQHRERTLAFPPVWHVVYYNIGVQVFQKLAAALRVFVVVNVVLRGVVNNKKFGPGQHRFECGDKSQQTVLVVWMEHNSDEVTQDSNGENVCTEAAVYGVGDTPAETEAAFGALMLRLTHAALVVRHE